MSEQVFPVSDEIKELFADSKSAFACRDQCIVSMFKAKRAIYYGKEAEKAKDKAISLCRQLWPELFDNVPKNVEVVFDHDKQALIRKENGKQ